jgi:hypothetical protein
MRLLRTNDFANRLVLRLPKFRLSDFALQVSRKALLQPGGPLQAPDLIHAKTLEVRVRHASLRRTLCD